MNEQEDLSLIYVIVITLFFILCTFWALFDWR